MVESSRFSKFDWEQLTSTWSRLRRRESKISGTAIMPNTTGVLPRGVGTKLFSVKKSSHPLSDEPTPQGRHSKKRNGSHDAAQNAENSLNSSLRADELLC